MSPQVLREMAGERAAALAALVPGIAAVLGPFPLHQGTVEVERRRTYDAVAIFLRRLCARQPVLLLVDDLHHAGLAVLELLHYVRRHAGNSRLLIVATLRTEEAEEARARLAEVATTLELGQLSAEAVTRLAANAGQSAHAEDILARTGGHTLYVVESLRGLAAGESHVPGTLQEAVLARVSRAGAEAERVLRAAAVLGSSFEPATVGRLLDVPAAEAVRRCEDLLRARLLAVAERDYEFAHDLVREVLYRTTPAPTRLAYHRSAADVLTDQPEAMAVHAVALGQWARAARCWRRAAEGAMRRYAATDAEGLLDRAIDAAARADDLEELARAHLSRSRVREALGRYEAAVADQEITVAVARDVGDARTEMLALRELGGDASLGLSRPAESALAHLEAGLRLAGGLADRGMQADFLARQAVLMCNQLRFRAGVDFGERAVAVARMSGERQALAKALDGAKTSWAYLGDVAGLEPILAELEPLLRHAGDLWRLQWTVFESSFPFIAAASWQGASARIEAALAINRRSGYAAYEGWFTAHLGWVARLQGRYDDAVGHGRRAMTTTVHVNHAWFSATAAAMLATTLLELGDRAAATEVLRNASTGGGQSGTEAYRLRYLAALAEATGSPDILAEADRLLGGIDVPAGRAWLLGADAYLGVARAWLEAGRPDRAELTVVPLLDAAARVPWVGVVAEGALVTGRCAQMNGDRAAARTAFERAHGLAARHGMTGIERISGDLLAGAS